MKFFFRSKDQTRSRVNSSPSVRSYNIKLSGRDYERLKDCDTAIKFWLPDSLEQKIEEMCSFLDTSASDLIRQILFIHLYGRYDLFGLIERQDNTFKLREKVKFCISPSLRQSAGQHAVSTTPAKNIADAKVWVPVVMKSDLQRLSDRSGKKLSVYVREVIVTHLFGHVPPEGIEPVSVPPLGYPED